MSAQLTTSVAKPQLRLTRRGRALIVLLAVVTAFVVFSLGRWGSEANASYASDEPTTRSVIVETGQTLWEIAKQVRPGDDPRDTIADLEQLNPEIEGGLVLPGQEIVVPL